MAEQRTALVTGTSSGIGMHTAVGLAAAGLRVVATMRNPDRSGRLLDAAREAGVDVDVRALDVVDTAQAEQLVHDLGRVDVLINNAGRSVVGTLEELELADLHDQLAVNYLGVAALSRLVLPGMRTSGTGRIVTVTSVGGVVGQPFADAYCGAKFAVEGLMQSLAPVVARFGVDVCIVEPAAVASEFVRNAGGIDAERDDAHDDPYADLRAAYLARSEATFANAQPAADAARTVVEAATTAHPKFRWQTSPQAEAFAVLSL